MGTPTSSWNTGRNVLEVVVKLQNLCGNRGDSVGAAARLAADLADLEADFADGEARHEEDSPTDMETRSDNHHFVILCVLW